MIQKTLSVALAVIIIITTSGFTVFEHHCNTERTTEFSLLIPDFDCEHDGHGHEELPHCCSTSSSHHNASCTGSNCCDIDSHIVKLDITLDTQSYTKKVTAYDFTYPDPQPIEITFNIAELSHIRLSTNLSPPLSGKSLIIFLQQLNIPDPSV